MGAFGTAVVIAREALMYELYNVKGMGSMSVQFLLDEMDIPYINTWMTIDQVRTPEFRQRSPLGFVPALRLKDGRTLFETSGIITFLVTTHADKGLSPPPGSHDFGEFQAWLQLMNSNLYRAIGMVYHGDYYAKTPEHHEFIVERAIERCNSLWEIIERRLDAKGPWLMGHAYSALDIYAFVAACWSKPSELTVLEKFPNIAKLANGVRARPKPVAALKAHDVFRPGDYHG
jgi:glutathione S-transferase